jgi:hypothetical protein
MLKLLKSAYHHRLFRMGESDYLLYMCYLPDITGQILPVYLHDILYHTSHFVLLNNASFHRLFRMGKSDCLYDNMIQKPFSIEKKYMYFSFYSFWKERICRVEIHMLFRIGLLEIKIYLW